MERGSEGSFEEWEEEDVGSALDGVVLEDHHLGFVLHVAAVAAGPVGAPPELEAENARESDTPQFAEGDHVPAACLVGGETDEASGGGGGSIVGRWSGCCYVRWDLGEDCVVVSEES